MAQRIWRSDDTDKWLDGFGDCAVDVVKSADETASLPVATCTGTEGTKTLTLGSASTFANGDIVVIIVMQKATGAGVYEFNKIVAGAGSTTLTMKYNLTNTYAAKSQIVGVVKARNFTLNSGKVITVPAWNGSLNAVYPVFANGDISIAGNIRGNGANGVLSLSGGRTPAGGGFIGGGGYGATGGNRTGGSGEGSVGDSVQQTAANGNGGGGGYCAYSNASGGGGGSNGAAGGTGSTTGGTGGAPGSTVGDAALKSLFLGGAGGGGVLVNPDGNQGGSGGNGGCIIILVGKNITITGSAEAKGGLGYEAINLPDGGSGAGGSILLKGKNIVLGTNLVLASGGAATSGGGAGGAGRIHADYSKSISGTTTPAIDATLDPTIVEPPMGASAYMGFV